MDRKPHQQVHQFNNVSVLWAKHVQTTPEMEQDLSPGNLNEKPPRMFVGRFIEEVLVSSGEVFQAPDLHPEGRDGACRCGGSLGCGRAEVGSMDGMDMLRTCNFHLNDSC